MMKKKNYGEMKTKINDTQTFLSVYYIQLFISSIYFIIFFQKRKIDEIEWKKLYNSITDFITGRVFNKSFSSRSEMNEF